MKILKEGKVPELRRYRHQCQHCMTVFQFVETEAREAMVPGSSEGVTLCPLPGCSKPCFFRWGDTYDGPG